MLTRKTTLAGLFIVAIASEAVASTLSLVVDHHFVSVTGSSASGKILRVVWAAEPVRADLTADVFEIVNMPSTRRYYAALSSLASSERWADQLQWSLQSSGGNAPGVSVTPRTLSSTRRNHGPAAATAKDQDVRVPMTTLKGRFDFGTLEPGDYVLSVSAAGLRSSFPLSVRTGDEPDVRDAYLRFKAETARDFQEYRRLQLQRFRLDNKRLDALAQLIDRSLEDGTLAETREYFDQLLAAYARRRPSADSNTAAVIDAYVRATETARDALPEYFSHRQEWKMVRDHSTGVYTVRSRQTNAVVRVLTAPVAVVK